MAISIGNQPIHSKITSEDIKKVKDYVREGLALPTDLIGVAIKFDSVGVDLSQDGVSAEDLRVTFKNIYDNATSWGKIDTALKTVSASLSTFSADLDLYAGKVIKEIKGMDGYKSYTLKIKDLTDEQVDKIVMAADECDVNTLVEYVEGVEESIEAKRKATDKVKESLTTFQDELVAIEKDLGAKLEKVSSTKLTKELKELNTELAELAKEIEDGKDDLSFDLNNFLGRLYNSQSSIGGMNATQWKKYVEKVYPLVAEQARKSARRIEIDLIAGIVGKIHDDLSGLKTFVAGAYEGVMQIDTLWSTTVTEITESRDRLEGAKEWKFLHQVVTKMQAVINDWANIKRDVDDLIRAAA